MTRPHYELSYPWSRALAHALLPDAFCQLLEAVGGCNDSQGAIGASFLNPANDWTDLGLSLRNPIVVPLGMSGVSLKLAGPMAHSFLSTERLTSAFVMSGKYLNCK